MYSHMPNSQMAPLQMIRLLYGVVALGLHDVVVGKPVGCTHIKKIRDRSRRRSQKLIVAL